MGGHHLVMGELTDIITSESLADTHDERYRQRIARFLIKKKEYAKSDIIPRKELIATAGNKKAKIKIDFVIQLNEQIAMIINYGPGSLVTRQRPTLAMSRLAASFQIPVAVVTNGESAEILEGGTGRLIGRGLDSIPDRAALEMFVAEAGRQPILPERAVIESRLLYAYEVDGACPCDETICRL